MLLAPLEAGTDGPSRNQCRLQTTQQPWVPSGCGQRWRGLLGPRGGTSHLTVIMLLPAHSCAKHLVATGSSCQSRWPLDGR